MLIVVFACLVGVSLYLAKRRSDANTALRNQVASLKRQLKSNRS